MSSPTTRQFNPAIKPVVGSVILGTLVWMASLTEIKTGLKVLSMLFPAVATSPDYADALLVSTPASVVLLTLK